MSRSSWSSLSFYRFGMHRVAVTTETATGKSSVVPPSAVGAVANRRLPAAAAAAGASTRKVARAAPTTRAATDTCDPGMSSAPTQLLAGGGGDVSTVSKKPHPARLTPNGPSATGTAARPGDVTVLSDSTFLCGSEPVEGFLVATAGVGVADGGDARGSSSATSDSDGDNAHETTAAAAALRLFQPSERRRSSTAAIRRFLGGAGHRSLATLTESFGDPSALYAELDSAQTTMTNLRRQLTARDVELHHAMLREDVLKGQLLRRVTAVAGLNKDLLAVRQQLTGMLDHQSSKAHSHKSIIIAGGGGSHRSHAGMQIGTKGGVSQQRSSSALAEAETVVDTGGGGDDASATTSVSYLESVLKALAANDDDRSQAGLAEMSLLLADILEKERQLLKSVWEQRLDRAKATATLLERDVDRLRAEEVRLATQLQQTIMEADRRQRAALADQAIGFQNRLADRSRAYEEQLDASEERISELQLLLRAERQQRESGGGGGGGSAAHRLPSTPFASDEDHDAAAEVAATRAAAEVIDKLKTLLAAANRERVALQDAATDLSSKLKEQVELADVRDRDCQALNQLLSKAESEMNRLEEARATDTRHHEEDMQHLQGQLLLAQASAKTSHSVGGKISGAGRVAAGSRSGRKDDDAVVDDSMLDALRHKDVVIESLEKDIAQYDAQVETHRSQNRLLQAALATKDTELIAAKEHERSAAEQRDAAMAQCATMRCWTEVTAALMASAAAELTLPTLMAATRAAAEDGPPPRGSDDVDAWMADCTRMIHASSLVHVTARLLAAACLATTTHPGASSGRRKSDAREPSAATMDGGRKRRESTAAVGLHPPISVDGVVPTAADVFDSMTKRLPTATGKSGSRHPAEDLAARRSSAAAALEDGRSPELFATLLSCSRRAADDVARSFRADAAAAALRVARRESVVVVHTNTKPSPHRSWPGEDGGRLHSPSEGGRAAEAEAPVVVPSPSPIGEMDGSAHRSPVVVEAALPRSGQPHERRQQRSPADRKQKASSPTDGLGEKLHSASRDERITDGSRQRRPARNDREAVDPAPSVSNPVATDSRGDNARNRSNGIGLGEMSGERVAGTGNAAAAGRGGSLSFPPTEHDVRVALAYLEAAVGLALSEVDMLASAAALRAITVEEEQTEAGGRIESGGANSRPSSALAMVGDGITVGRRSEAPRGDELTTAEATVATILSHWTSCSSVRGSSSSSATKQPVAATAVDDHEDDADAEKVVRGPVAAIALLQQMGAALVPRVSRLRDASTALSAIRWESLVAAAMRPPSRGLSHERRERDQGPPQGRRDGGAGSIAEHLRDLIAAANADMAASAEVTPLDVSSGCRRGAGGSVGSGAVIRAPSRTLHSGGVRTEEQQISSSSSSATIGGAVVGGAIRIGPRTTGDGGGGGGGGGGGEPLAADMSVEERMVARMQRAVAARPQSAPAARLPLPLAWKLDEDAASEAVARHQPPPRDGATEWSQRHAAAEAPSMRVVSVSAPVDCFVPSPATRESHVGRNGAVVVDNPHVVLLVHPADRNPSHLSLGNPAMGASRAPAVGAADASPSTGIAARTTGDVVVHEPVARRAAVAAAETTAAAMGAPRIRGNVEGFPKRPWSALSRRGAAARTASAKAAMATSDDTGGTATHDEPNRGETKRRVATPAELKDDDAKQQDHMTQDPRRWAGAAGVSRSIATHRANMRVRGLPSTF